MSDIEGGQSQPSSRPHSSTAGGAGEDGGSGSTNRSNSGLSGLFGSLLHRPHSASPTQPPQHDGLPVDAGHDAAQQHRGWGVYRRPSTVPEDGSSHSGRRGAPSSTSSAGTEVSFGAFLRPGSSATSFASNFLPQQPSLSSSSAPNQQQQQQGVGRHRKSRSSGGGGGGGGGAGALNRAAEPLAQLYSSSHGSERSGFSASRLDARSPPSDTGGKNGGGLGKRTGSSASAGAGGGGVSGVSSSAPSASGAAAAGVQKGGQVSTAMGNQMVGRMSMVVRVSEGAQRKYMHMVPEEEIEKEMQSSKHLWSRGVIHPLNKRYRLWWYFTVFAACLTGWLTTYRLAFLNAGYNNLHGEAAGILELMLLAIFSVDILISFLVGYYDKQGLLVMEAMAVARHYIRHRFFLDILTTLPWDWIVLHITGIDHSSTTGRYVALLSLLKLGRMYRLAVMFYNISYNLNFSLLSITLMRNFVFCFFLLHWAACGFWYVALQEGPSNKKTWVAAEADMLDGSTTVELYIFSFYWALVTFATLGYGDVTPSTTAEVLYTIIYVMINIVVWAYVLGTITLLVTKQDEELGVYRQRMQALNAYCNTNNLPHELKQTMAGLLRLHMSLQNEAQGDEQVLGIFPTTIRRKILRQLYSNPLKNCYLFRDTGVKFLDALMLGARVELFLPKVEIVSALDHANELYIVVAGFVEVVDPELVRQAAAEAAALKGSECGANEEQEEGAENAFTAGMLTAEQVQYAATLGQPGTASAGGAVAGGAGGNMMSTAQTKLTPLIEHQQQFSAQHANGGHGAASGAGSGLQHSHTAPPNVRWSFKHRSSSSNAAAGEQQQGGGSGGGGGGVGSKLLAMLPGWLHAQKWRQKRGDSWRKQQEQLNRDRYDMHQLNQIPHQALSRASRSLIVAGTSGGGGGSGRAAQDGAYSSTDVINMPAFAMRNLSSMSRSQALASVSKLPQLQQSSGGGSSSGKGVGGGLGTSSAGTQPGGDQVFSGSTGPCVAGKSLLGPGDCFAEVAYFTEVPKAEAVRSLTVCRVLVIPRSTYNSVARDFPLSARQVLENLKLRAQELVEEFLPRQLAIQLMKGADARDNSRQQQQQQVSGVPAGSSSFRWDRGGDNTSGSNTPYQQQPQDPAVGAAAAAAAAAAFGPRGTSDSDGGGAAAAAGGGGEDAAAAAAAAARSTLYHTRSPFSGSDVQKAGDAAAAAVAAEEEQQEQTQQQQAGGGAGADSAAAATAAAMQRLTSSAAAAAAAAAASAVAARTAFTASDGGGGGGSGGGVSRSSSGRKDRPLLSSMSVNLSGRYSMGGAPRSPTSGAGGGIGGYRRSIDGRQLLQSRSTEAEMLTRTSRRSDESDGIKTTAAAAAAAGGGLSSTTSSQEVGSPDERQGRALARFSAAVAPRHRTALSGGGEAELLQAQLAHAPTAPLSLPPVRTSTLSPTAMSASSSFVMRQPLSPRQHQQRANDDAQRLLKTLSLLPQRRNNEEMARAWEGLPQQQQTSPSSPRGPTPAAAPAGVAFSDHQQQQQQKKQQQQPLQHSSSSSSGFVKLGGLRYEEGSRIYSDEEVQAVAAALPEPLTIQQQRLLADLLRLKRLVNKAAAKYDQMQLTSFLDAASTGEVDVVQDMLRQGMNPNTADYDGRTALMIAAYRGKKDVVLALLFAGADTTLKDTRGFDVMIEAARGSREDVIDVLKRSGARTGISSTLQASLQCKATYEGKLDRLGLLLRAGCNPDAHDYDGQTALHVAASEGSVAAARVLIQAGASLTIKDRWGYSPLDIAHKVGAAPLVEYLVSHVAPDVASASEEGWKRERTEAALAAARYGDTAALARLLQRGCPVDAADYGGRSLLHVAVANKQEAVVKQLIAAGANVNVISSEGNSPLLEAAMDGSTAVQSELMSAGARLGLSTTEEAALLSSVLYAHRHDQLLALLTAGADPAAADYDTRTALHVAARIGDVGALQLMADAMADSGIERLTSVNWQPQDRWGDTPLQEAQRAGHSEAAAFLQDQIDRQQQQQQQQ